MNSHATYPQSSPTLLALATVARFRAQRLTGFKLKAQFISAILSAGSVFYDQTIAWSLIGAGLVAGAFAFFGGVRAKSLHEYSREAQRLALLEDSFGKLMDPFQTVELRRKMGVGIEEAAKRTAYEQPYYTGAHPPGTMRLRENIQQSTFWSRNLLEFYGHQLRRRIIATIILVCVVIYLILAAEAGSGHAILNPYPVSLGGLILVMGILGYAETALFCKSAVTSLFELDRRLNTVDLTSSEATLANFADYCIAGVSAPPIPFSLYRRHHSYLRRMWALRSARPALSSEVDAPISIPEVEYAHAIVPTWMTDQGFSSLIRDAVREMVVVAKRMRVSKIVAIWIPGLSGTPVYDVRIYIDSMLWRQVVLRMHSNAETAKRELAIVKMIGRESADLVSYVPVEEPFVSRGALFYYHANIQTNDQLLPLNEFVEHYFSSSDATFDSYFLRMLGGLRLVAKCFDNLSVEYSVMDSRRVISSLQLALPPKYVIDLRRHPYEHSGNNLTILSNNSNEARHVGKADSQFSLMSRDWCRIDSFVINDGSSLGEVHSLDIDADGHRCRILIPTSQSRAWLSEGWKRIVLTLIPSEHVLTLSKYLDKVGGIGLDGFDPERTLQGYVRTSSKQGLYTGFRHRDLHCLNCLVSMSNFKVIDVGDSGPDAMVCADVARLELSLLSCLSESGKLNGNDIEGVLLSLERGRNSVPIGNTTATIARAISEIRRAFIEEYRVTPSRADWALGYYLECCQQVSYSVWSPMRLSSAMGAAVRFWQRKVVELSA